MNLRMKKLKEIQERKTRDGHSLSSSRKRKEPPGHTPPGSPLTGISKSFEEESERRTLPASSTYLRRSARNTITARTAQASDQDEVCAFSPMCDNLIEIYLSLLQDPGLSSRYSRRCQYYQRRSPSVRTRRVFE